MSKNCDLFPFHVGFPKNIFTFPTPCMTFFQLQKLQWCLICLGLSPLTKPVGQWDNGNSWSNHQYLPCIKSNFSIQQRCYSLTHWGRVTHICISKIIIIGSGKGLSPDQCQTIIWTNAGILLIWPLGINFSETLIEINILPFKKMHFKMSSAKLSLFRLGLS